MTYIKAQESINRFAPCSQCCSAWLQAKVTDFEIKAQMCNFFNFLLASGDQYITNNTFHKKPLYAFMNERMDNMLSFTLFYCMFTLHIL